MLNIFPFDVNKYYEHNNVLYIKYIYMIIIIILKFN